MSKFLLAFAVIAVCLVAAQAGETDHSADKHGPGNANHAAKKPHTAQPSTYDFLDIGEDFADAWAVLRGNLGGQNGAGKPAVASASAGKIGNQKTASPPHGHASPTKPAPHKK
uniref:SSSGP-1D1 n=1 Tax=Mayetiola destructor TaxID=39758 RepID=D1MLP4_MAYDE|nr:SSSGP-1D1 [Mayetiola destructor]